MKRRFAIYYAPPAGSALEAFGCAWLGRDHVSGRMLPQPTVEGMPAERLLEITRFPRHYGFHGTLKAPFALARGATPEQLQEAASTFAAARTPFACSPLRVNELSGFIAFTLSGPCPALDELAADCVRAFERLRAPLPESEIERRRRSGLSPRQDEQLLCWGYPYVFEDFRFHMTLTDRLGQPERSRVLSILRASAAAVAEVPFQADAIAVYEQADREQAFILTGRYPFGPG